MAGRPETVTTTGSLHRSCTKMKHIVSRQLYAYWNRRRGSQPAPDRTAIEPYDLGPMLVDTFLLDLQGTNKTKFRFCGSNIAMRYGRDLADEDFLALWSHDDRQSLAHHLKLMAEDAVAMAAGVVAETAGGGFITFEMVLLPLTGVRGCDRAIGCLVRIGGHNDANRVGARIVSQSLRSMRFLTPRAEPFKNAPDRSIPPPPAPAMSEVRRKYGHLVVMDGGKSARDAV
jgi:hypothetical protein